MKLRLVRAICSPTFTRGDLYVNGNYECKILEDADRHLENNPEAKVHGQTCIPRGTYQIVIDYSNRFKRELPRLVDVPGFTGVRIHPGNTVEDTEGCLLPGYADPNDDSRVVMSRKAFDALFARMEQDYDAGMPIEIEVV